MRLGIFSDIHANYEALSAVLEAYKAEDVDEYYCLGDTVGYGGSPNECADLDPRAAPSACILGNHDAAVAGPHGLLVLLRGRAPRARHPRAAAVDREHAVAPEPALPVTARASRADLCHGSPVRLEEFEYIFAPEQARECLPIYDELGHLTLIGHSHLCKVFALTPHHGRGAAARRLRARSRTEVHRERRLGGPAARLRQPRQLHGLRHRQEALRVQARRVRHRDRGRQGLRAKLERNFAHRLFIGV